MTKTLLPFFIPMFLVLTSGGCDRGKRPDVSPEEAHYYGDETGMHQLEVEHSTRLLVALFTPERSDTSITLAREDTVRAGQESYGDLLRNLRAEVRPGNFITITGERQYTGGVFTEESGQFFSHTDGIREPTTAKFHIRVDRYHDDEWCFMINSYPGGEMHLFKMKRGPDTFEYHGIAHVLTG